MTSVRQSPDITLIIPAAASRNLRFAYFWMYWNPAFSFPNPLRPILALAESLTRGPIYTLVGSSDIGERPFSEKLDVSLGLVRVTRTNPMVAARKAQTLRRPIRVSGG
jgi:hypothetical protein